MARLLAWLSAAILAFGAFVINDAQAQEYRDITLEDIIQTQRVTQVSVSPDGEAIAFTRFRARDPYADDDGPAYSELFVIKDGETVPFVTGDVRIGSIEFSHDGRFIYYLANRSDDDNTNLYRIPVRGGESKRLIKHDEAIRSFTQSDDGRWLAFLALEPDVKDRDTMGKHGFRAQIFEEELRFNRVYIKDMHNDDAEIKELELNEQVHSIAFRPGHEQLLMRVAPTQFVDDDLMLSSYAVFTLEGDEVVRMDTEGKLGRAAFSPDGSELALIGAEDKHDPAEGRLLHANLDTGETRDLVPGFPGHIRDMVWRNNSELLYMAEVGAETEVNVINVNTDSTSTLIDQGHVIVSRLNDLNDGTLTILAHSPAHPPEVYQFDGELNRLTDSNPWLAEVRQPRQEVVEYHARDGLRLEGILVYPLDYEEGKQYPVILDIHGGPEAHVRNGWIDRYSSPTWYMAQEGFATFFPNYRGSTGRGVDFSKLGQNDYAGKEFDDNVDAKEHLVEIGLADPDRVGITGGSYGGYASAWGATKQTEHFAASVMFVGISNNLSKFGTTDIPNEMHLVHARSYPWDKWDWYLERSPIYWAEQGRTPILIMHGAEDTRVHPAQSMELYRYLKVHGNVPVRLVLYPGEGHGNARAASQLDYAQRMARWMNYYLVEQGDDIPPHELNHADRIGGDKKDDKDSD